jgi:hypothetical protein
MIEYGFLNVATHTLLARALGYFRHPLRLCDPGKLTGVTATTDLVSPMIRLSH